MMKEISKCSERRVDEGMVREREVLRGQWMRYGSKGR